MSSILIILVGSGIGLLCVGLSFKWARGYMEYIISSFFILIFLVFITIITYNVEDDMYNLIKISLDNNITIPEAYNKYLKIK